MGKFVTLFGFVMTFSATAFASPADNCVVEAEKSASQVEQSLLEGNEQFVGGRSVVMTKLLDGWEAVTEQKTNDHHRLGDVTPNFVTKVTIRLDNNCAELGRLISKRQL